MNIKKQLIVISCLLALTARAADPLAAGFDNPPEQTQPWCYWYWISDNISKEGVTKDLEAMRRVGIGEALIGNIFLDNQPAGPVKVFSDEWWDIVRHTFREADRVGVNIGLFNCPGWSQSGGPWVKAEQSMRYLVSSETRVTGPQRFEGKLATPPEPFQQVSVQAFPVPQADADQLSRHRPSIRCTPEVAEANRLLDGDLATSMKFPEGAGRGKTPFTVELEVEQPFTARSLQIIPTTEAFGAECELAAQDDAGQWQVIRRFNCDRSNMGLGVGPMPRGPVCVAFAAVSAKKFRLTFTGFHGRGKQPELAEISLSGAARLESFVEKQLGKMHPTPLPMWDTYLWPVSTAPESASFTVDARAVRDLTRSVQADGTLRWDVPPGEWIILRTGMTPTGVKNSPASPEGQGLELDKMNRRLAKFHFDAFVGEVLKRIPAGERKRFTRVVADSYETGSQNWTDGFEKTFHKTYGYDPLPWLPVLTGRIVGSADQSERFLWDLRRLVADHVAQDYVGGLRDACNPHGLELWLENYGHWGFPGEFLKYGGESDRIAGEFWVTGSLGSIECRAASSAANIYGKPFVSAESFTGGPPFQNAPHHLKARGDWSFCEGINHVVLHVYIQQPADGKIPGINAPWGTEFNRHNTWFDASRAWVDYERRACWLLQQGHRVADVAYFIGEDAPKMTGVRQPELPAGRDFDYINAEVITQRLKVRNGLLTVPDGPAYRVLVLPQLETMRPEVLRKIRDLVKAGATVLGPRPTRSPSLANYPDGDGEVRKLAADLWGDSDREPLTRPPATLSPSDGERDGVMGASAGTATVKSGERKVGKGRVIWGKSLDDVFAADRNVADIEFRGAPGKDQFLFTHRRSPEADIYFVSNQKDAARINCAFRVTGRQPELWDAVTGERRALPEWSEADGRTIVPLTFAPKQSWFVVFRKAGKPGALAGRNFPEAQVATTIPGAWEVSFEPQWGGLERVTFDTLTDWTKHPESGIQFYSGPAVYRKTFELPESALRTPRAPVYLDLGDVRDVAVVRLNGKEIGTIWTAPWRLNIAAAAKAGENRLEITIINPWNNRLVGDAKLPADQRRTSLSLPTVKANSPLQSAGLLGPVTILTGVE